MSVEATRGVMSVRRPVRPDGTFKNRGLVDGPWTVEGMATADGATLKGRVSARPGDDVVIGLEASTR